MQSLAPFSFNTLICRLFQVKEVTAASEADDDPDPRHYQVPIICLTKYEVQTIKKNQTGDTFSLLSTLEQRIDFGRLKQLVRTPSQSPPDITLPQKIVTDQQINGPTTCSTSWC